MHELTLDLPPAEIGIPHALPLAGARTRQLKVTGERVSADRAAFTLEAPGGTVTELPLRINRLGFRLTGAVITSGKLRVRFPEGEGYQRAVVTFTW
jgi:hypothetical protein